MLRSPSATSFSHESSRECFFRGEQDLVRSQGSLSCRVAQGSAQDVDNRGEPQSTAVRVVVRFRPAMPSEEEFTIVRDCPFMVDSHRNTVESSDLQHRFYFDRAFDMNTSQSSVYEEIALPLVNDVLQGYHATILAYGQTGGGKTYCMFGPPGNQTAELQGLVPRSARHVFENIGTGDIECSFVEVYCEQVRDLLTTGSTKLQVKEIPSKGFCIEGLTHKAVKSTSEVWQVLRVGLRQRAAANTRLNQHSSRSHAIFTLHVVQEMPEGMIRHSKLTLVDLAGSEKLQKSGSAGEMLEEAKKINVSLLALGHVIDGLAERRPHIPYRDSRLTRILEDSLGGNCRTTLLVACSPSKAHIPETLSSLRFAGRAKKVCNMVSLPHRLDDVDRVLINRITSLRRELKEAHQELERRIDGKNEPTSSQARRTPRMSQRQTPRMLLRSWDEDNDHDDQELVADSGGTGCQPRLLHSRSSFSSWSSLTNASLGKAMSSTASLSLGGTGASREDEIEPKNSPRVTVRTLEPEVALAPSPQASSDATSTAIGSGSASSSAAILANSASVTPLSSGWDAGDEDLTGRRISFQLEARRGERGNHIASYSRLIGNLEKVIAKKKQDDDQNTGDAQMSALEVRAQQDLHWRLEMERHRNAALTFQLGKRVQESQDLRRQLETAEVRRLASTASSILGRSQSLQHLPVQSSSATVVNSADRSQLSSRCTLHAVQIGTVVRAASAQRGQSQVLNYEPAVLTTTASQGVDPARITPRTKSHSPLRQQRASYVAGLQHAQASSASRSSPLPAVQYRAAPLSSSSQSSLRVYPTLPSALSIAPVATSPRQFSGALTARSISPTRAGGSFVAVASAPRAALEAPVAMLPGSAAEKAIASLREELQRWVNSVS